MTALDIQLHDNTFGTLGNPVEFCGDSGGNEHASLMVTRSQVYYLRVTRSRYGYSGTGTYRIAFNTSETAP